MSSRTYSQLIRPSVDDSLEEYEKEKTVIELLTPKSRRLLFSFDANLQYCFSFSKDSRCIEKHTAGVNYTLVEHVVTCSIVAMEI